MLQLFLFFCSCLSLLRRPLLVNINRRSKPLTCRGASESTLKVEDESTSESVSEFLKSLSQILHKEKNEKEKPVLTLRKRQKKEVVLQEQLPGIAERLVLYARNADDFQISLICDALGRLSISSNDLLIDRLGNAIVL